MKFEILKSEDDKFCYNIITDEGLTVLTSRQYEQKSSMVESIKSIIEYFIVNMSEHKLDSLEVEDLTIDRTREEV